MRNTRHIVLLFLLGLSVLAGCRREIVPDPSTRAQLLTEGPADVSMTLSIKGFGDDRVMTKGAFYDPDNDFVSVNDTLFYAHERKVRKAHIFLFDAENAFLAAGSQYTFNPAGAVFIAKTEATYIDERDTLSRIQFKIDKPYKSLAVIILANYPAVPSYTASGGTLADCMDYFSDKDRALAYDPDQDKYIDGGIPMHGWKVFGSLEGLSTSNAPDSDEAKKRRLKYYKGMTTPLTVKGFEDPTRLEEYARETSGKGVVNQEDHVGMEFALARLQLRYAPRKGAIPHDDPLTPALDSVRISGVKLNIYKDKFRILPENWADWADPATRRPNPYTPTTYHAATEVGDFTAVSDTVHFREVSSHSGKSRAFVAYVPEMSVASVRKDSLDKLTAFREPSLIVQMNVKIREMTDGTVYTYIYDRNKITVKDGTHPPRVYEQYGDQAWVSWLRLATIQKRKDDEGNNIPAGTRFSLVRHYAYEWLAVGVNE